MNVDEIERTIDKNNRIIAEGDPELSEQARKHNEQLMDELNCDVVELPVDEELALGSEEESNDDSEE